MAPSTTTPSDLHRASVACLQCRKAKVRCLVSHRLDRCNRCIAHDTGCVFTQPKRARVRSQPYSHPARRENSPLHDGIRTLVEGLARPQPTSFPTSNGGIDLPHTPSSTDQRAAPIEPSEQQPPSREQPVITNAIRARIVAALASLRGKRGSPFSFVTSQDSRLFGTRRDLTPPTALNNPEGQASQSQSQKQGQAPNSLKLSSLLRPLTHEPCQKSSENEASRSAVKMPSYSSLMTIGQTIQDPIEGGIIPLQSSRALFDFFLLQLNVKWEYILDSRVDTHDNVRQRSPLLFATILFCSSKFANAVDAGLVSAPDPFLQTRLCSLARNLVVKSLAEGDRTIETMQALYLLVCWKDADDDISYLHTGYAFRVLHDVEPEQYGGDELQAARRRRTWLALFRQDRQQSLFFMRRPSLNQTDEESFLIGNPDTWRRMRYAMPSDMAACCSADLRRVQGKLRALVQEASAEMLPCLVDLMEADINDWRLRWKKHLETDNRDPLLYPDQHHLDTLVQIWDHSVRLNIASGILRQALLSSVASQCLQLGIRTIQNVLSPELPGLLNSIEGAFGTLRRLLDFPLDDLRRAPDAILLLGPSAALFLCLLLCLPEHGMLGPAFQHTAVCLIRSIAQRVGECVQSPQDTLTLYATYLQSLVELLDPSTQQPPTLEPDFGVQPPLDELQVQLEGDGLSLDVSTLQEAQVLTNGVGDQNCLMDTHDSILETSGVDDNIYAQSLANLLRGDLFWEAATAIE
ncbi:hypothetical protein BDW60DRAFT_222633 [Aspergillus nidulans var. acristatus]